jgi:uncharacterized protein (DUF2141 family)
MRRLLIGFIAASPLSTAVMASAEADNAEGFTVSGTVKLNRIGTIYLQLLSSADYEQGESHNKQRESDKETPRVPATGELLIEVGEQERKQGQVTFVFEKIPPGVYAIQGFLDVNGNGKFDMGSFGPKAPWGNYRSARPTFRGPKFPEMQFEINQDIADIAIELK